MLGGPLKLLVFLDHQILIKYVIQGIILNFCDLHGPLDPFYGPPVKNLYLIGCYLNLFCFITVLKEKLSPDDKCWKTEEYDVIKECDLCTG